MTPDEFLSKLQARSELVSWFLELVPPGAGGTDLRHLPPELEAQLKASGITEGSTEDKLNALFRVHDWVTEEYAALSQIYPVLPTKMSSVGKIAAGTTSDAEFNGHVYKVEGGTVIVLPFGAFSLLSHAAEMVTLLGSYELWQILASATSRELNIPDSWSLRLGRRLAHLVQGRSLKLKHEKRLDWQYNLMMRQYVDLGVVPNIPDSLHEIGPMPQLWDVKRLGHPLEAGGNLRRFAIRFLMLHEIGHILCNHFHHPSSDDRSQDDELQADHYAISFMLENAACQETAVAVILGTWLVFSVSGLIERLESEKDISLTTHPPAWRRSGELKKIIEESPFLQKDLSQKALRFLDELTNRHRSFENPLALRGIEFGPNDNALIRLSRSCAEHDTPKMFYDQVPRWMLFGAPLRLCRAIALGRRSVEERLLADPGDRVALKQLELFMWVYAAAERSPNSDVANRLQAEYKRFH